MSGPADLDVLIVDDHEAMRALLARTLQRAGVTQARTAADGEEALAALRERPANLILADQTMPGMDGLTLLKAVRSDPVLGAARFVIISGHSNEAFTTSARATGADAVLVKPVTPHALLAALNELFAV